MIRATRRAVNQEWIFGKFLTRDRSGFELVAVTLSLSVVLRLAVVLTR